MKVSEAIAMLSKHYKPEDDIIIAWWDKEGGDFYADKPLTPEAWKDVVDSLEFEESLFEGVSNAVLEEVQATINGEDV